MRAVGKRCNATNTCTASLEYIMLHRDPTANANSERRARGAVDDLFSCRYIRGNGMMYVFEY